MDRLESTRDDAHGEATEEEKRYVGRCAYGRPFKSD
jgi:hypothetical protein